jgi:hypothetical protein
MSLLGHCKIVPSIVPTVGSVAGCTETEINCTGFDRCLHIIVLGAAGNAGATFDYKVTEAPLTGMANAADITSAALTEVTGTAGGSKVYAIETRVNPAKPFQIAVGVVGTNTFANAAVAVLYQGSGTYPKTAATQAINAA